MDVMDSVVGRRISKLVLRWRGPGFQFQRILLFGNELMLGLTLGWFVGRLFSFECGRGRMGTIHNYKYIYLI